MEVELHRSSYPAYWNQSESPDWLYKESVFEELGSGQPTRAYGRFVEQGNGEETVKFYAKNHWPAVRGSERFAGKAYLQSNAASKEVHHPREVISSQKILSVVAQHMSCEKKSLLTSKRGRGVDNTGRGSDEAVSGARRHEVVGNGRVVQCRKRERGITIGYPYEWPAGW